MPRHFFNLPSLSSAALAALLVALTATISLSSAATAADDDKPNAEEVDVADEPAIEVSDATATDAEEAHTEKVDKPSNRAREKQQSKREQAKAKRNHSRKHSAKSRVSRDAKAERVSKDSGGTEESPADSTAKKSDDKDSKDKSDEPKLSVTHHTATIDGKEIAYTATAGKMVMKTDDGDAKAHVFFVAYTKDAKAPTEDVDVDAEEDSNGEENDAHQPDPKRPITYCFNGGPGSSSVWLHLGMLGPVRVKLDSDAGTLPPPHELIANPYSLLDVTDLVFIDPVSTGFSRPVKGQDKKQFHGYDEDLKSVGQFIHDYTTKFGRWGSPKFLIGESYGGLRAAGLSGEMQNRYRMYFNGVVLVSAVVDFQTLMTWGNNDIAFALFLPSFTATAWYHKQLPDDLQKKSLKEVVNEAERFATGPYLRALAEGDSVDADRRKEIIKKFAELTGLPEDYVDDANLRVSMAHFGKQLLRQKKLLVGRFDSRYVGNAIEPLVERTEYDPSASAVFGRFGSALNDYVRGTLKVEEDRVYEILTDQVHPWDYSEFENQYVDASETLRYAMTLNPHLKVFAACGYYDLATPSYAMEHTRNHLHLADDVKENFTLDYYEGGHMMYAHEPSLEKLRKDLLKFYKSALDHKDEADDKK